MAESKGYSLGTGFIHATVSFDGIGKQIAQEMRKAQKPAQEGGKDTGEKFEGGFRKGISGVSERLREAVASKSAVAVAAGGGFAAGKAWTAGFNRAVTTSAISKSVGTAIAGLSGLRVLKDLGTSFKDFATNLDRTVPKIGLVGSALGSLSAAGIAGVGGILGVTQALGSIAAVALTLPGLIGAGAASMAVFGMAMADVGTVLADLGPRFAALQDSVSGAFWERAAQPIRNLADSVFPILQQRMVEVAHEMGGIGVAIANTVNTASNLDAMDRMFVYLRDSIDVAGDGVGAMTEAVMKLGLVGSSYLPNLAGWFNEIAYATEGWVAASIATGRIFDWIDTGLMNLRALGGVLVHTVGIFHALGKAATDAGAGGLVGMAGGLERINEALHTDMWQGRLVSMFSAAGASMDAVGRGLSGMGDGLANLGPTLNNVMVLSGLAIGELLDGLGKTMSSPALSGGLQTAFEGILAGVRGLTGGMGGLGPVVGAVLNVIGALASNLGPVLGAAFDAVGPAVGDLGAKVADLARFLGPMLIGVIQGVTPIAQALGAVLSNVVLPPLIWVAEKLGQVPGLFQALGVAAGLFGVAIGVAGAATAVSNIAMSAAVLYVKAYRGVAILAAGATKVMAAGQWLLNAALTANPIGIVIAALVALGVGLALAWRHSETFRSVVTGAWDGVKSAVAAVGAWFTGTLVPGFRAAVSSVGGFFTGLNTRYVQPAMIAVQGVVRAVAAWFTGTIVPNFHKSINELGLFFDALYRNFIAPFVWAFEKVIGYARDWFSNTIVPAFRVAIMALGAAFNRFLNATIRPVWTAIRTAINLVASWFNNTLLPFFRATIARLGDAFSVFKSRTIDPVWNGIRSVINIVGNWFRNVLVPAFRAAVQSLQNKFTTFRATIVAVWDRIKSSARTAWDFVDRQVFQKFRNGLTVLETAFSMTRKGIADQWEKLREAVKKPIAFVVTKVINPFLSGYNKINDAWSGDNIDPIPGFRTGGYTGRKGRDEVAGVVHGDEHVIRSESRRDIERTNPGLLERLNRNGASALPSFGHEGHAAHGGMAAGGPGGPGTYLWGGLQNSIYASGVAHVRGSAPGYDLAAAARAWNNMSNLKVRYGSGPNQINVGSGAPAGTWGYAWSNGQIQLNPNIPQGMKTGTAAHEIGHVLGLDHAGTNSIMHPMMRGPLWPSAFDRSTIQRIYGGSGKGNPPEGGGGGGLFDWIADKISPLTKLVSGPLKAFKAGMGDNLFSGMAGGIAQKVTDGLIDHAKQFLGMGDGGAGLVRPFADQKWDDPVGTVHKLSPGVSSIYNGTGGDEFFQRVGPGSSGGMTFNGDVYTVSPEELFRTYEKRAERRRSLANVA